MGRFWMAMVGVLPMLAATGAFGQGVGPQEQGSVRAPEVLPSQVSPSIGPPPAIGSVDGLPVRVWAPVPPPYDALADRTGAADPIPLGPDWWPLPSMGG